MSDYRRHGQNTDWTDPYPMWAEGNYRAEPPLATYREYKRQMRRSRRRAEPSILAAELAQMCDCPKCRGGYERQCYAFVDCDEQYESEVWGDGP